MRSHIILWILSLSIGVIGYLSFLEQTPEVILNRIPLNKESGDYAMTVGKGLLALGLLLGIAVRVNPTKLELSHVTNKSLGSSWNEIFTFILLFGSATVALILPDIYGGMTIIGGIGATVISYIFPGKYNEVVLIN